MSAHLFSPLPLPCALCRPAATWGLPLAARTPQRLEAPTRAKAVSRYDDFLVWTDGSCLLPRGESQGPGGWAFVALNLGSGELIWRAGHCPRAQSCQMELASVAAALDVLPPDARVQVLSDFEPMVKSLSQARAGGEHPRRLSQWGEWQQIWDASQQLARLSVAWVRGHAQSPGNRLADKLAVRAARKCGRPLLALSDRQLVPRLQEEARQWREA